MAALATGAYLHVLSDVRRPTEACKPSIGVELAWGEGKVGSEEVESKSLSWA